MLRKSDSQKGNSIDNERHLISPSVNQSVGHSYLHEILLNLLLIDIGKIDSDWLEGEPIFWIFEAAKIYASVSTLTMYLSISFVPPRG